MTVFRVAVSRPSMPSKVADRDRTTTATATPLDAFRVMNAISLCVYSLFLNVIWKAMNRINRKMAKRTKDFKRKVTLKGRVIINPTKMNTNISRMFEMTPEKSNSFSFSFR